ASHHAKGVIARRNVAVGDSSLGGEADPFRLEWIEAIFEEGAFGRSQSDGGKFEIESAAAGRNFDSGGAALHGSFVDAQFLDDRARQLIRSNMRRIDGDDTLERGEPKQTIGRTAAGGLKTAGA